MASSPQLQLFASLLIFLLLWSPSRADPFESDLCNGEDAADLDDVFPKQVSAVGGCHFAGACETGADCGRACAAQGLNPNSVKCLPDTAAGGGGRCCCSTAGAGSLLP